ncbi:unnamed protein product [Paramecium sonneborni]|uniref:CRAL-TRIO domain-containing protein n=1 Tax=Paramecium sonneborni TaxID=65129 RepID=A0A8S1NW84_9CILI|nr:unnamed protein product [Paramecium sonneborni]
MIDYSYLAPPKEAHEIVHTKDYIKYQQKEQGVRRIFETVVYDQFEMEKVKELKEEIKKQKIILSSDWKESDYLRISYAGRFNKKEVIKKLQQHIAWRCNKIYQEINSHSEQLLKEGICYLLGRDKQFRPIIIMNAHQIDQKKHDKEQILQVLSFLLGIVKKNMLIPGKVETWVFLLDTGNLGGQGLQQKVLEVLIDGLSTNFSGYLERMFVLNPSSGINFLWQSIKTILDPETINKISFLQQKEFKQLKEYIEPNQLEQKFGGNQVNLTKFWPPYNLDLPDGYTKKDNKSTQKQEIKIQNMKIEEEEENDPYDQVEFNLNDFMKQQQQIYYGVSNNDNNNKQLQIQDEEQIDKKQDEFPNRFIQEREHQTNPQQINNQQIILDEPEQPDLQQQIVHQEEEKKQNVHQNQEIKESTEQVFLTERQKNCQQLGNNDTEQNKILTHDEQGFNSSANKLNEESNVENIQILHLDPVNNDKGCCQKCEIF